MKNNFKKYLLLLFILIDISVFLYILTNIDNRFLPVSTITLLMIFGILLSIFTFYLFLEWNLFAPIKLLNQVIQNIEKDDFKTFDFDTPISLWQNSFLKLNILRSKISETASTLQMLFSVSQALTSQVEIKEIFNIITGIIKKKFENVACSITLLDEDGFLKIYSQKDLSPEFVRVLHVRPGEDFLGLAFQKCQTIVVSDSEKQSSSFSEDAIKHEGIASFVHVPLFVESKCAGVVSVYSQKKDYFNSDKIETISTLAEYLSIALRNAKLYERINELNKRLEGEVSSTTRELTQTNSRLIQKVREMKVLSDIGEITGLKTNLHEILEMIEGKIKELLSAQLAGFFLYSAEINELVPHFPFFGVGEKEMGRFRFRLDEIKVFESIMKDGMPYVFNDSSKTSEALPFLSNMVGINSLILVPLRSGKKHIGILGVANKLKAPFTQDDLRVLNLIADRVASVIDNVTLYKELEHRLRDLMILQEISSAISSEPDWDKTLRKIISSTKEAFDADLCALLLYDEKSKKLVTQPGAYFTGGDESILIRIPIDDPNSLSTQVFRYGESFISQDALIDPRIKSQTSRLWDVRSLILVPLRAENRVIGVLRIGKHQSHCYNKDHLRLATLIAHQSAVIIENAQLYDSLRSVKNELERLNLVKNEFISVVSHEIKTPITSIKGFVKIVLDGEAGTLNPQQEKFLRIAYQSTERLTTIISDLLDISRIESGQMSVNLASINPKEVVESVIINLMPTSSKKDIKIENLISDNVHEIMADKSRLAQVFDNLIQNSIKFTNPGGSIKVWAEEKSDYVLFNIEDTGIGITQKDQQKIFEKFYQAGSGSTHTMEGAGLGLAIVKSIIEIHKGRIWVESEPGKGSTFRFHIPNA